MVAEGGGGSYFWEANREVKGGRRSTQVYGIAAGEKWGEEEER